MYKKKKGIYIIEFDTGCKVGMSHDCDKRIDTYKAAWCQPIKNIAILECQYPKIVERRVIDSFSNKTGEFIHNKTIVDIQKVAEKYRYYRPDFGMMKDRSYKTKTWEKLNPLEDAIKALNSKLNLYKAVKASKAPWRKPAPKIKPKVKVKRIKINLTPEQIELTNKKYLDA